MKQLPIPVSKECSCVGVSLCSLCVPSGFGGRAESWSEYGSHLSPGSAGSYHLGGKKAGDGGARARARCEMSLLLCSVVITTHQGQGRSHGAGAEALWVGSKLVPFSVNVCSPPPINGTFIPEGSSSGAREDRAGTLYGLGVCWDGPSTPVGTPDSSWSTASMSSSNGYPHPIKMQCQGWTSSVHPHPHPHKCTLSSTMEAFTLVGSYTRARGAGAGTWRRPGTYWGSGGKLVSAPGNFNLLPSSCSRE